MKMIYETVTEPILKYTSECWTLRKQDRNRTRPTEMIGCGRSQRLQQYWK